MQLQLPISVIGFGSVYAEFFNAIAATLGSPEYGKLIKLMVLLGGTWTVVMASVKQHHGLHLRWILTYIVLTSVVLLPNVTVIIHDRTSMQRRAVSNVPLGLGLLAHFTSSIGTGFTELVEGVFHTPKDFTYTHSGMLFGSKIIGASSQFQVVGGTFAQDLQHFVHQCVFYDVLLHKYSLQALVNAPNLWAFVTSHASPARAFMYHGKVVTCQQGAQYLSQDWNTAIDSAVTAYIPFIFQHHPNAKAQLLADLPLSFQYFAKLSDDAATLMKQQMMIHAIQQGVGEWQHGMNVQGVLASMALTKVQQQKRLGYHLLYRLAVYWLPLSKAVMELILYGAFLILVLFVFFPFGLRVATHYVMALVWLQCWPPLFAFSNFILTVCGAQWLSSATRLPDGSHGLTLSTYTALNQLNADLGTLAGFFAALTPLLAVGLFKGMMTVFSQAANYIGGAIQSFAFAGAGEAVSGNLSLGNSNFANHSAYNMNNYHQDSNARVATSMMSYQLADGGTASVSSDSTLVVNSQGGISQLPVTPHMAQSMQLSLSKLADNAQSTAIRDLQSTQRSYASGLRQLYELGSSHSHTTSSGTTQNITSSGAFSHAAREVHQLVDRFAKEHHVSHGVATQLLGAGYAGLNFRGSVNTQRELLGRMASWITGLSGSGSITFGARGEASHSTNHQHSELFNQAQSFVKDTNFGQTVESALRAVHDDHYRTSSDAASRVANSLASTFEEGNRYAHDAMTSYEQSVSYRQQASLVEQDSVAINTQATQAFVNWLQQQPSIKQYGGGMNAQAIMTMMQNDLPLAQHYAQAFVREQEHTFMQSFAEKHFDHEVKAAYQQKSHSDVPLQAIHEVSQQHENVVSQMQTQIDNDAVDPNIGKAADTTINVARNNTADKTTTAGQELKNSVNNASEKGS